MVVALWLKSDACKLPLHGVRVQSQLGAGFLINCMFLPSQRRNIVVSMSTASLGKTLHTHVLHFTYVQTNTLQDRDGNVWQAPGVKMAVWLYAPWGAEMTQCTTWMHRRPLDQELKRAEGSSEWMNATFVQQKCNWKWSKENDTDSKGYDTD